jgi:hypothetical protein
MFVFEERKKSPEKENSLKMWNNESDRILSSDTNCDVVNALHKMRSSNVLCDVVLAVSFKTKSVSGDGKNLSSLRAVVAHRAILVAASPYFYRVYEDKRLWISSAVDLRN